MGKYDRHNYDAMVSGELYTASDPLLHELTLRAQRLAMEFNTNYSLDPDNAQDLVCHLLGSVGEDTHVRAPMQVDYGIHIHIGKRTFVNFNLMALDVCSIHIGDDCQIGPNVQLLTPTHPIDPQKRLQKLEAGEPIVIEDNVWLGGGVIVCPGVRIGKNSVIGAGSVVTKDIPANSVALGNPARVVKSVV